MYTTNLIHDCRLGFGIKIHVFLGIQVDVDVLLGLMNLCCNYVIPEARKTICTVTCLGSEKSDESCCDGKK